MNSCFRLIISLAFAGCMIVLVLVAIKYSIWDNQSECFNAAVLDHFIQIDENDDFNKNFELNFKVFKQAAYLARENEVDLIVFPESALMHPIATREQALNGSLIFPKIGENLCKNSDSVNDTTASVLERLSCLAFQTKIYLAAQLLEKIPCKDSKNCPSDGYFVFNTAILFGRKGDLLAKYHKMHPFGELSLNVPPNEELISVETEIGRLGLQICFDLIFESPGHKMASQNQIDTMIFPVHWFNEAPFLSASQYQMAWALGNKINLLASNIHLPWVGSLGSGIYTGGSKPSFLNANFEGDTEERLIVANIPINPRLQSTCLGPRKILKISQPTRETTSKGYRFKQMNSSFIQTKSLDQNESNGMELEYGGVKCKLSYKANFSDLNQKEKYFLIVSNRSRPSDSYEWGEEFCAVVFCSLNEDNQCQTYSTNNYSIFKHILLEGSFDTRTTIYPSAVSLNHRLIALDQWRFEDKSQSERNHCLIEFGSANANKFSMLSILSLYGRAYSRDPLYVQRKADGFKD